MVRPGVLGWGLVLYAAAWMAAHLRTYIWYASAFPGAFSGANAGFALVLSTNALIEFVVPLGYLAGGAGVLLLRPWARRFVLLTAAAAFAAVALYYLACGDLLSSHISAWSIGWGFSFKEIFHLTFGYAAWRMEIPPGRETS